MMNPNVDQFLIDGCGRCDLYKTPQCKVLIWHDTIIALRDIILLTELREDYKWSQPCYTINDKNVLLLSALKDYAFISFFKGALIDDTYDRLIVPGPNSKHVRLLRFETVEEVELHRSMILDYIQQAIALTKSGKKVITEAEEVPEELQRVLDQDPTLKMAFNRLTPGRQRSYIIHINAAKQAQTKYNRIEKCRPKIMKGLGHNEYEKNKRR